MPAALPTVTVQNGNGASVALPEVFTSPIRPYVFCLRVRFFASREGVREGFSHASFSSSSFSSSGWGFCPGVVVEIGRAKWGTKPTMRPQEPVARDRIVYLPNNAFLLLKQQQ